MDWHSPLLKGGSTSDAVATDPACVYQQPSPLTRCALLRWRRWRSWNCFGMDINSTRIMKQVDAVADRSRTVNGKKTSLLQLGYEYVGLDDVWMKCNSGPGGHGYHDADGNPIVDLDKFPGGLSPLTQYGNSKGAKMGWYLSACGCPDQQVDPTQKRYRGDVNKLIEWGFDAVKIDGGGNQHNDSYFVELLNETSRPILQLYSFSGPITATECPNNYHGVSVSTAAS